MNLSKLQEIEGHRGAGCTCHSWGRKESDTTEEVNDSSGQNWENQGTDRQALSFSS